MERLIVSDRDSNPVPDNYVSSAPTLGWIGPYEVRDTRSLAAQGRVDFDCEVAVVCPPELRRPDRWNYTHFKRDQHGTLVPVDSDVELDPYHMCLLYQLITGARDG